MGEKSGTIRFAVGTAGCRNTPARSRLHRRLHSSPGRKSTVCDGCKVTYTRMVTGARLTADSPLPLAAGTAALIIATAEKSDDRTSTTAR